MGAGQHAVADFDGAHGAGVATVDAGLAGQDLATNDLGFDLEQQGFDGHAVESHALFFQGRHHVGVGAAASLGACLLVANLVGGLELGFGQAVDLGDQGLVLGGRLPVPGWLAGVAHQLVDRSDRDVALLVTEHHGAEHDFFAQLLGFGFHHQHGSLGASDHEVKLAVLELGLTRIEHVLAVHIAHARSADGAVERDAADRQGGRGGDHGRDIGLHFGVQAHHVHDHLDFVVEAFGEQRADRAVDQAAGQGFQLAGAAFALEEAAGDLAGGVRLFGVVHRQGEEVLAGLGFGLGDHGGEHHGVIDVDQHGAGGLAGDFTGFHGDRVRAPLEGLCDFVEHAHGSLLWTTRESRGGMACRQSAQNPEEQPRTRCHSRGAACVRLGTQRLWNDTASLCCRCSGIKNRN
ncbi:hypothetical protein Y695_02706 [Hydrogenophaga sp. T4]|nr:hypothetical protein Y695_02706 [Hydrogenophaga sp. T4]